MLLAGPLLWCQLTVLYSLPVLSQSRGQVHCVTMLQKISPACGDWYCQHDRGDQRVRHNHSVSAGVWGGGGNPQGNSWHHLFPSRFPFSVPNPVRSPSPTTWITRSHVLLSSQLFCEKYFWKQDRIPWSHELRLLSALKTHKILWTVRLSTARPL